MKFSLRTGLRPVATSFTLAALLLSASALPLAPQSMAAEYKVTVAEYKVAVKVKPSGLRSVRLYGSSPWVCTPSGFGQKARCYLRKAA